MHLPNPDQAVVDIAKLRDHCLSPVHPVGKHKALVFRSALGLTQTDAPLLDVWIREAARTKEASAGEHDQYGQRFVVEFEVTHRGRTAKVRTAWIVRTGEDFARLVTCPVI